MRNLPYSIASLSCAMMGGAAIYIDAIFIGAIFLLGAGLIGLMREPEGGWKT